MLEAHPAAMQLRTLGTLLELGTERNSTIAFPVPMELLRVLDTPRRANPRTMARPPGSA